MSRGAIAVLVLCVPLTACGDGEETSDPEIVEVSPAVALEGDVVEVAGKRFGGRASTLILTGIDDGAVVDLGDSIASWSSRRLSFEVPAGTLDQLYALHVEVSGVPSNRLPFEVELVPDPEIAGVDPPAGEEGDSVTITGSYFGGDTGAVVFWPSAEGAVESWSETEIVVEVPPDVLSGSIRVRTAAGFLSVWHPFSIADPNQPTLTLIQDTIFTPICATGSCHGLADMADLSLAKGDSHGALVGVESSQAAGKLRVEPFSPASSLLLDKVSNDPPAVGERMPLNEAPLSPSQIDLIRAWIEAGAEDN